MKKETFAEIDVFLCSEHNVIRAINYGVHEWATRKIMKIDHPGKLIPSYAISSIALHHIAVRPQDFEVDSACLLDITNELWDLHDFAHHTSASLSPEIYGSKYFTSLVKLPSRLTSLIRSPGMQTAHPEPRCSDGVVFSELLTPLFEDIMVESTLGETQRYTYDTLTEHIATVLVEDLIQKRALRHKTIGTMITMKTPLTPEQLAVLAQNKAYELTVSEIEQRVLTRGGPAGDSRDELDSLNTADKIRQPAVSRAWMYFEVRNTIKHRAHKLAYQKITKLMPENPDSGLSIEERKLVRLIVENL